MITIQLTEDQLNTLVYEIGDHATLLYIISINRPYSFVKQNHERVQALQPIHKLLFEALDTHLAIERQLGDYQINEQTDAETA